MTNPYPGMVGIGTGGNIGTCDEYGVWVDRGLLDSWPLASCGTDPQGHFYGVGQNGNMDFWEPGKNGWTNGPGGGGYSAPSGWGSGGIRQYLFGPGGIQWVVSPGGNIGKATPPGELEDVTAALGGWTVKMLAYDSFDTLWCIGTAGNVGQLLENGTWSDYSVAFGGWTFNALFYDPQGMQWSIGTSGNVGQWEGDSWTDHGLIGGWTMGWLYWPAPNSFPIQV